MNNCKIISLNIHAARYSWSLDANNRLLLFFQLNSYRTVNGRVSLKRNIEGTCWGKIWESREKR